MTLQKNRPLVWLFSGLLKFSGWLQRLPGRLTPPPFRLIELGSAFWQSRCLYVAARLDIATQLADETLAAEVIAARVAAHPDATSRLLRMLAAIGVFDEIAAGHFRNNRVSAFLRSDNPLNVRAMILMHNSEVMSRPWYEQLEQGIRLGAVPFELSHGAPLFAYMDSHPHFDALFSQAMESVEALSGDSYATDFDWAQFERVIDVGGSRGGKSVTLLQHHPHLRALVVDRPQVINGAHGYWQGRVDAALLARLAFQAGDVTEAVPVAAGSSDIYLLSALLHGFDDAGAGTVLRNLATAISDSGARIALLELVMPEHRADLASASFDMQMLMGTQGRERTLGQWQCLLEQSGLQLEEVVGLRSFGKLIVARCATQGEASDASPAARR